MSCGHKRLCLFLFFFAVGGVAAFDGRAYEEPAGLSFALFSEPSGDVYGGGFESGIWLKNTPVFGEWFGHWLANDLQQGNYYVIGLTLRLMPRTQLAPFSGFGASYNGLLDEHRTYDLLDPPDDRYWSGHVEAGFRWNFSVHFVEATYRYHWTDGVRGREYGLASIEYGQSF